MAMDERQPHIDDDLEDVNPRQVLENALEDPIATHDAVVAQMENNGAEWVPPDQKSKKIAHVRWFAHEVESSFTVDHVSVSQ